VSGDPLGVSVETIDGKRLVGNGDVKPTRRGLLQRGASGVAAGLLGSLGWTGSADAQIPPGVQQLLDRHNGMRAIHCSLWNMVWIPNIQEAAQRWANTSPSRSDDNPSGIIFDHEPQSDYGENLAWAPNLTGMQAIDMWYSEMARYNFNSPPTNADQSRPTGHFSQVVWRNTVIFGMASAQRGAHTLWVARYFPRGNILGQFQNNVFWPFGAQICPARPPVGGPVPSDGAPAAQSLPTPTPTSPTDILRK